MRRNGEVNPDWIMSAGHCVNNEAVGAKVYHSDTLIGEGSSRAFSGSADFGLIKLGDDGTGHRVFHYYPDTLEITGSSPTNTDGAPRCFTGRFSGTKCGTIVDPSYDVTYANEGNVTITDLVRTSPSNISGDSGGPTYQTAYYGGVVFTTAAGIVSGHTGNDMLYAKLGHVPSSWNVVVRRKP